MGARRRVAKVVVALTLMTAVLLSTWEVYAQTSVEQTYLQTWSARERGATSVAARRQLASDLIAAASDAEQSNEMRLFICQRAYLLASRDRECYPLAAKALELMQQIDPATRLDALQKLRQLYQRAYEAGPSRYLGMGIGYADATVQVAEQRRQEIDARRSAGELPPADVITELAAVQREYSMAQRIVQRVLISARSLADSMRTRNPSAHQQLVSFIERNEALARDIDAAIAATEDYQSQLQTLMEAIDAFNANRTPLRAERVAQLYLIHLDSPGEAIPYAELYLDAPRLALLKLAASSRKDITPEDALKLSQWYAQLANMAPLTHRPAMLIRAYNFLSRCNEGFASADARFATAQSTLAMLRQELASLNVEPQPLTLRASDAGDEAVAVTPPAPTPAKEPTPVTPPRQTQPTPVAQTPRPTPTEPTAQAPREPATPISALPTDRAGRPIAMCVKCRFEFSPLPGDSTTICQRCASGRRNIFDFGDE